MSIIEVKNVCKSYLTGKVEFKALAGVSLSLSNGDFAVLAGPSGSGKTTMLNLIGGLDVPSSGEIKIQNEDIHKYSEGQLTRVRRDKIGFIFQNFNLIPTLTAYENVELPLILKKIPAKERREKVLEILKAVGLDDKAKNHPTELSGGQQQRVAIARALVSEPAIVLADEPTANLDSKTGQDIINLLKKINAEKKVTILFSTHDSKIMNAAKRIFHLKDGLLDYEENIKGEDKNV